MALPLPLPPPLLVALSLKMAAFLREHVKDKLEFLAGHSVKGDGGSDPQQLRNAIFFYLKKGAGRFEMKNCIIFFFKVR